MSGNYLSVEQSGQPGTIEAAVHAFYSSIMQNHHQHVSETAPEIKDLKDLEVLINAPVENPEIYGALRSSIRIDEAFELREREKREFLLEASLKTAEALATEESKLVPDHERLAVLKLREEKLQELATTIYKNSDFNLNEYRQTYTNCYQKLRVKQVQETLVEVSLDLGFLYGRDNAEIHIEKLRNLRSDYLSRQQIFLKAVDGLMETAKDTVAESERLGINIRVKIEKVAGLLHQSAVGVGAGLLNNHENFCATLRTLTPRERALLEVVFEERQQYQNELPRMFSTVWNAIRGVKEEKKVDDGSKGILLSEESDGRAFGLFIHKYFGPRRFGHIIRTEKSEVVNQIKLEHALALTRGDSIRASAAKLFELLHTGWRQKIAEIEKVLQSHTPSERKTIESIYNQEFAGRLDEKELPLKVQIEKRRCSELTNRRLIALLDGDQATVDACWIKENASSKGKLEELYRLIKKQTPEELKAIADRFDEQFYKPEMGYDHTFFRFLKTFVPYCPEKQRLILLLDGDQAGAEAAMITEGIRNLDGDRIALPFFKESEERRIQVLEAYERTYGKSLLEEIDRLQISDVDKQIIRSVAATGELCPAALIRHALELKKPDLNAVKTVLEGRTDEEIQKIAEKYEQDYDDIKWSMQDRLVGIGRFIRDTIVSPSGSESRRQRFVARILKWTGFGKTAEQEERTREVSDPLLAMREDMEQKFAGIELFDAQQLLEGNSNSGEEVLERVRSTLKKEQAGIIVPWILSRITRAGKIMRRDVQRIEKVYREEYIPLKKAGADTGDALKHLDTLLRIARENSQSFRFSKEKMADEAANWGSGFALLAAVSMATAASAPFWLIPTIAGMASMGSRTLLKALFKGHSYNPREFFYDFCYAVIDGGMLASGSILRRLVQQKGIMRAVVRSLAKIGFKQMVNLSRNRLESIKSDKATGQELNPEAAKDVLTEVALSLLRR